jgi:hypothetical protein
MSLIEFEKHLRGVAEASRHRDYHSNKRRRNRHQIVSQVKRCFFLFNLNNKKTNSHGQYASQVKGYFFFNLPSADEKINEKKSSHSPEVVQYEQHDP